MRTLSSAIVLFSCVLIISLSASGQEARTAGTSSQVSGGDCAPTDGKSNAVKWDLIYPASDASYVGGTVPEMNMSAGTRLLQWASLQPRQFRRNGRIALAPGCLLFAFNAKEGDSFTINANYQILRCSNKVKFSDKDRVCQLATGNEPPESYVLTVPYAKVNVLSRAKYPTSDLTSVSTAYAAAGGSVLTAISSSLSSASTKDEVLGLGGTAGFLTVYYIVAIARPRMRDNYIAVFVEPPAPQISLSRQSNVVSVITSSPRYFRVGQQIEISGVANSDLAGISKISRDKDGIVTVTTDKPHGLTVGAKVQIAEVTDPSFNGQFKVGPDDPKTETIFTYEQKDKPKKADSGAGKVQDVWNDTFVVKSVGPVDPRKFTYWQVGPNDWTPNKEEVKGPNLVEGTAAVAAPGTTDLTVNGTLDLNQPAAEKRKPVDLTGTATLKPPPAKSDELFKKADLMMFRIPNHHDYYNISMTLSGGTGLTFVSETAEKTGK